MGGLENKTATYTDTGLFGYGLTTPIIEFWQKRAQALIPPKETEDEKDQLNDQELLLHLYCS